MKEILSKCPNDFRVGSWINKLVSHSVQRNTTARIEDAFITSAQHYCLKHAAKKVHGTV